MKNKKSVIALIVVVILSISVAFYVVQTAPQADGKVSTSDPNIIQGYDDLLNRTTNYLKVHQEFQIFLVDMYNTGDRLKIEFHVGSTYWNENVEKGLKPFCDLVIANGVKQVYIQIFTNSIEVDAFIKDEADVNILARCILGF